LLHTPRLFALRTLKRTLAIGRMTRWFTPESFEFDYDVQKSLDDLGNV
jgi:hypothetical protein